MKHRITRDHIQYRPSTRGCHRPRPSTAATLSCSRPSTPAPGPSAPTPTCSTAPIRRLEPGDPDRQRFSAPSPGDSLCITSRSIDLADRGFLRGEEREGLLAHLAEEHSTRIVEVKDDVVRFGDIRFPRSPDDRVVGTAPPATAFPTAFAGPHGRQHGQQVRHCRQPHSPSGLGPGGRTGSRGCPRRHGRRRDHLHRTGDLRRGDRPGGTAQGGAAAPTADRDRRRLDNDGRPPGPGGRGENGRRRDGPADAGNGWA